MAVHNKGNPQGQQWGESTPEKSIFMPKSTENPDDMVQPDRDGCYEEVKTGEYIWIPSSEVCCIETVKGTHYCDVKCKECVYSLRGNIRDLELCMGTCFWRCRASTQQLLLYQQDIQTNVKNFLTAACF